MGFPSKNDHFGVFWGYHYFWKHPYIMFSMGGMLCKTIFWNSVHGANENQVWASSNKGNVCVCFFFKGDVF